MFVPSTDLVIEDLYKAHNSCLGQLGLNVWRSRTCLRFLVEKVRESFSLKHLIQIYLLKLYKGSILILASWYTCSLLSNAEDYSTENGRRGSLKYLPEKSWAKATSPSRKSGISSVASFFFTYLLFVFLEQDILTCMMDNRSGFHHRSALRYGRVGRQNLKSTTMEVRTWKVISLTKGWEPKNHGMSISTQGYFSFSSLLISLTFIFYWNSYRIKEIIGVGWSSRSWSSSRSRPPSTPAEEESQWGGVSPKPMKQRKNKSSKKGAQEKREENSPLMEDDDKPKFPLRWRSGKESMASREGAMVFLCENFSKTTAVLLEGFLFLAHDFPKLDMVTYFETSLDVSPCLVPEESTTTIR